MAQQGWGQQQWGQQGQQWQQQGQQGQQQGWGQQSQNQQQYGGQQQQQWGQQQGGQQNQQWNQQQSQQPQQGGGSKHPAIRVSGCQNQTVADIITGTFQVSEENHGKPVYKKDNSSVSVLLYFWDERDGPNFCGWWFGPKVGGDQVWAYNGDKSAMVPPTHGWKVPWDGPVDQNLVLQHQGGQQNGGGGKGQQQGWGQNQQQGNGGWGGGGGGNGKGCGDGKGGYGGGGGGGKGNDSWGGGGGGGGKGNDGWGGNNKGNDGFGGGKGGDGGGNTNSKGGDKGGNKGGDSWGNNNNKGGDVWGNNKGGDKGGKGGDKGGKGADKGGKGGWNQGPSEEDRQRMAEKQAAIRAAQEEQRKKMEEERKAKEEELKRKQAEREEQMRKRQEELQKKRQEEENRKRELAAGMAVRKAIQKVRVATPEKFDELRAELEKALEDNLEKMGEQAEKVQKEAEQALLASQERVEKLAQEQAEEAQRKEEEEARRKEEAEKLDRLSKEAVAEVEAAETQIKEGEESVKLESDASPEDMLEAVEKSEQVANGMVAILNEVSKSVQEKRLEMGNSREAAQRLRAEFADLFKKLAVCRRKVVKMRDAALKSKDIANKKTKLKKRETDIKDLFNKFDKDKDGKLKKTEISAFSKGKFDYELTKEDLEKIMRQLAKDDIGVPFEKFSRLKCMVGIVRAEVRARIKRAEEAEKERVRKEAAAKREAELEEMKKEYDAVFFAAGDLIKSAATSSAEAEKITADFDDTIAKEDLKSSDLSEAAEKAQASATESRGHIAAAKEKLEEAESKESTDEDIKSWKVKQAAALKPRITQVEAQLDRVDKAAEKALEKAAAKEYVELDTLKIETVASIREAMSTEELDGPAFFKKMGGSDTEISCDKFVEFVKSLSSPSFKDGQPEKLYKHVLVDDAETLSKDRFAELIRVFYKVIKASVLTEEVNIKSKTLRRLDVGEIVEALEQPKQDADTNVTRLKCKTMKDDLEGFVTLSGNQGKVFLEPGGLTWKCVKDTPMTEGLSVVESKNVRKIKTGEVVDILEFEKLDESCNVKRIKIKAKNDGAVGWVSVAGNTGTAFMEPC